MSAFASVNLVAVSKQWADRSVTTVSYAGAGLSAGILAAYDHPGSRLQLPKLVIDPDGRSMPRVMNVRTIQSLPFQNIIGNEFGMTNQKQSDLAGGTIRSSSWLLLTCRALQRSIQSLTLLSPS